MNGKTNKQTVCYATPFSVSLLHVCVYSTGLCETSACTQARQGCGTLDPNLSIRHPSRSHRPPTHASPMWPQLPQPSGSPSTKAGTASSGASGWPSTSAASNALMPCWMTFHKRSVWQSCGVDLSFEADCADAGVLYFQLFTWTTALAFFLSLNLNIYIYT